MMAIVGDGDDDDDQEVMSLKWGAGIGVGTLTGRRLREEKGESRIREEQTCTNQTEPNTYIRT